MNTTDRAKTRSNTGSSDTQARSKTSTNITKARSKTSTNEILKTSAPNEQSTPKSSSEANTNILSSFETDNDTISSSIETDFINSLLETFSNKISVLEAKVAEKINNSEPSITIKNQLKTLNCKIDALIAENLMLRTQIAELKKCNNERESGNQQQPSHSVTPTLTETSHQTQVVTSEHSAEKPSWATIVGSNKAARILENHQPDKNNEMIRIRARKEGDLIDEQLKNIPLPKECRIIKSVLLNDGSRLIKSNNNDKIKDALKDKCIVVEQRTFRARVKVYDIPVCYTDEELLKAVDAVDPRIISRHKLANKRHLTIEVDKISYKRLINMKHLSLGWHTACRITTPVDAQKCGFCQRFGHCTTNCRQKSENAEAAPTCSFCNEAHATADCKVVKDPSKHRCANCVRRKKTSVNHSTYSDQCPVKLNFIRDRLLNTEY